MHPSKVTLKNTVDSYIFKHQTRFKNNNEPVLFIREEVSNISGYFRLKAGPYWSFIIEDLSLALPCIFIDKCDSLQEIICLNNCLVEVSKAFIIVESIQKETEKDILVSIQFHPEDLRLLKKPKTDILHDISECWNQRILVVHVTTPVIIKQLFAFCLVLAMVKTNNRVSGKEYRYLWILLKESQVAWHDLLVPNREYILHLFVPTNYFETYVKPLRACLGKIKGIQVFKEIIHHPELWPTLDGIDLPEDALISVDSSSNMALFNCQFSSAWWLSINEALDYDDNSIVTIWGEIVRIMHVSSENKDGCSLCTKKYSKKLKKTDETLMHVDPVWANPWDTKLNLNSPLLLPKVDNCEYSGFSFPDTLTKIIIIKELDKGKPLSLYLKKWSYQQYSSVFTPGVIICAKFVHKRISAKQIPYFVSCALSNFEVISEISSLREIVTSPFIQYGFPFLSVKPATISWGILDQWSLLSVSLKYTPENNYGNKGSSNSEIKFSASAVIKINKFSGNPVTVILNNEHVKLLLEIPDDVWNHLKTVSQKTPLVYTKQDSDIGTEMYVDDALENENSDIEDIFYAFCDIRNAYKKRFHISCRFFTPKPGEDGAYFCTSIGDADCEHLFNLSKPLLSELLNKSLKF